MKTTACLLLTLAFTPLQNTALQTGDGPEITADEIKAHIQFLASDELEGRFTGDKGAIKAGDYVRDEFKQYGLAPAFGKDYFQEFPFVANLEITGRNILALTNGEAKRKLSLNEDYVPAPFSGTASFEGELVFVGYGISAPDLEYDDYEGIDVEDKAVLVMRYHPEYDNPHSQFEKYASFRFKAINAREKGAKAVVFVNGHLPNDPDDKLMPLKYDQAGEIHSLAVLQIKRSVADDLFAAGNMDFLQIQKNISENKSPNSLTLQNVRLEVKTEVKEIERMGRNVAGLLEGGDHNLSDEFLVIGAHFDHLGFGKTGSLYRGDEVLIHNGADDNGSGTAGLLELAEYFSANKSRLKRSILFVGFSGEELGLLGSSSFVKNSPVDLTRMVAMLNMDMIGRLDEERKLIIYGTGTSSKWADILNELNNEANFSMTFHKEGFGPSDHSSFYSKEIPVLHFFTGTHPDYHRPTDDAELINTNGMVDVLDFVAAIAWAVDMDESRPDYVNVPQPRGGRGGFRVSVGTIPDYSENVKGLKLSGVTKGGPAEKGGLKGGDIIVYFAGREITNIYDYTYALQEATPGDIVEVKVLRSGETLTFKVELGAR